MAAVTPTRILQISDLHFGPPLAPEVVDALLHQAPSLAADAIVVSGDLTQRAKRRQFEEARDFFNALPDIPKLIIPGNHDVPLWRVPERLLKPLALYREIICDDLDPVLEVGNVILAGLNSTAPRRTISNGRIDKGQLKYIGEVFSGVPADKVRIVVAHHHFAPGHDKVLDIPMPRSRRAIEFFVEHNVEMILGGHLHRSYIGNSLDFYPGHDREHGVIIVQCGTTTSRRGKGRERDENTLNLIEVSEDTLTVYHYLYFDEAKRFAAISKHVFPRRGKPFQDTGGASATAE